MSAQRQNTEPQHTDLDPVDQLLYATFKTRVALDRVSAAMDAQTDPDHPDGDTLFTGAFGRYLQDEATRLRSQLGLLAKQYIALGIEERQTRLFEQWSNILLPIMLEMFQDPDLQLTRQQRQALPQVVERHLLRLESGDQDKPKLSLAPNGA